MYTMIICSDDGHCLYTECVQPKSGGGNGANSRTPVIQRNHFCSEEHRFMAKQASEALK